MAAKKGERNTKPASVEDDADDASDGFGAYLEYNKVLRTWFVGFGIGGPALLLVNNNIAKSLVEAGQLREVVLLFLIGTTAQVFGALLNKIANWYVYIGTVDASLRGSRRQRFAEWLISQFWIDIAVDVLTILCFGYAAWLLMTVFAK